MVSVKSSDIADDLGDPSHPKSPLFYALGLLVCGMVEARVFIFYSFRPYQIYIV